ncbi:hypothetical protein HK097_009459, partial [Rhizophlyctis rosea]
NYAFCQIGILLLLYSFVARSFRLRRLYNINKAKLCVDFRCHRIPIVEASSSADNTFNKLIDPLSSDHPPLSKTTTSIAKSVSDAGTLGHAGSFVSVAGDNPQQMMRQMKRRLFAWKAIIKAPEGEDAVPWSSDDWGTIPGGLIHIFTVVWPLIQSHRTSRPSFKWPSKRQNSKSEPSSPTDNKSFNTLLPEAGSISALFAIVLDGDPAAFESFKSFSVGVFSAENPMFFQEYRALMLKIKAAIEDVPTSLVETSPISRSGPRPMSTAEVSFTGLSSLATTPNDLRLDTENLPSNRTSSNPTSPKRIASLKDLRSDALKRLNSKNQLNMINITSPPGRYLYPTTSSLPMPPHLLPDCRRIFRSFIAPGSSLQLNLSAHIVDDISRRLRNIPKQGMTTFNEPISGINVSIFDGARDEVLRLMFDTFPRFVEKEKGGVLKEYMGQKKRGGLFYGRERV